MQYESIVVVVKLLHSNLFLTLSLAKPFILPLSSAGLISRNLELGEEEKWVRSIDTASWPIFKVIMLSFRLIKKALLL